ncbi:IS encoded protein [Enterobacterales bacterium 8AC]|nr:IS encoded protein [Enterobacterales bacterium 8AC]
MDEKQLQALANELAKNLKTQKWTMPLRDWRMAMSRFIIEFGDRLDGHY